MNEKYNEIKSKNLTKVIRGNIPPTKSPVKLPGETEFYISEDGRKLKMVFTCPEQLGIKCTKKAAYNMQEDKANFEGWAAVLYTHYLRMAKDKALVLDIKPDIKLPDKINASVLSENPHYGRFLYRALRFREQYKWFELGEKLDDAVNKFQKYLEMEERIFMNNVPDKECGISSKDKPDSENAIEKKFAETPKGIERLKSLLKFKKIGKIHRQLPVGLFEKIKKNDKPHSKGENANAVFTGGKSAIDLWTISGDTFYMLELKNAKNKKVGAITEMFFYSNYIYDMFVKSQTDPHFAVREEQESKGGKLIRKDYRGYGELLDKSKSKAIKNVKGFLLLYKNCVHPLISKDVLEVLNNNNVSGISYGDKILTYTLDEIK